jgi:TRAP-type C4-dicarboxylate transport system permease small subunit
MVQLSYANNERQYLSLNNIDLGNNALLDNSLIDDGASDDGYNDLSQARWLARYYTGEESAISSVALLDTFTADYPSVNRLLPVYRVSFANEAGLSAYVHTETNALAGLNNDWKTTLQWVFKNFHSWSWLDDYATLRVGVILYFMLVLLALTLSGISMLLTLKRRQYRRAGQRFHRLLAWWVCLPLLGFVISGSYHLLQQQYGQGLQLPRLPIAVALASTFAETRGAERDDAIVLLANEQLNQISVISHRGQPLLRASIAVSKISAAHQSSSEHDHHDKPIAEESLRNQRFDGINKEHGGHYFALSTLQPLSLDDQQVAKTLATDYWLQQGYAIPDGAEVGVEKITRFGNGYDFRHKRLPVWKITLPQQRDDIIFVDTFSGLVVEHVTPAQQWEGLSFSLLHKWNMLTPLMGREYRDALMVFAMLLALMLSALGVKMRRRG